MKKLVRYPGGATRSSDSEEVRFDLIPPIANLRRARRWQEGAERHGANNWRKGMPLEVIVNHLQRHLELYRIGDQTDDHLAAAAWALDALMECEFRGWKRVTGAT